MARFSFLATFSCLVVINAALVPFVSSCQHLSCELPLQDPLFVQHSNKFWAYDKDSRTWIEADITQILNIYGTPKLRGGEAELPIPTSSPMDASTHEGSNTTEANLGASESFPNREPWSLPLRRRLSIVRVSEASIWVTGESGAIYERFWNGLQWVTVPHDLPNSVGCAVGVLTVNHTMVALSEAGMLYQLQIDQTTGQPIWMHCGPSLSPTVTLLRPGESSAAGGSLYFATSDGSLAELTELHPLKWVNHGRPRGGDVAAIADAGALRPGVVFSVSKNGDLYEFNSKAKPAWKKHIRAGSALENLTLLSTKGASLHGLAGASCISLFLLTQSGLLVERRFHQRKWQWQIHKTPTNVYFGALGPIALNDLSRGASTSLFLTSVDGNVYEYKISKFMGVNDDGVEKKLWVNHTQPSNGAIARSVPGTILNEGRFIFVLDDGRIGELHFPGQGGEGVGPFLRSTPGKRSLPDYQWSTLDSPESEGGNAGYCTVTRGPSHCVEGTKEIHNWDSDSPSNLPSQMWKKVSGKGRTRKNAAIMNKETEGQTYGSTPLKRAPWTFRHNSLFRMRTMQFGRSFFLVGDDGNAYERFYNEGTWIWLKHDHSSQINGLLGMYNGSVFAMDTDGYLFMRERVEDKLIWLNCSALDEAHTVMLGPPWDGVLGELRAVTVEDALFFVDSNGRLVEFTVALRKFSWKDCGHPSTANVASILDQEVLRFRVIFVVGTDGRLYHFNRVTRNWYSHNQPSHIVLSGVSGTVIRSSYQSMAGSLFMRSEDGGLVEFHWDLTEGWVWTDHGSPGNGIVVATSPGPSFGNWRMFMISSEGHVLSRYLAENQWKWADHKYPALEAALIVPHVANSDNHSEIEGEKDFDTMVRTDEIDHTQEDSIPFMQSNPILEGKNIYVSFDGACDSKVAPVRPIALSKNSAVFMLKDGRLAQLKQVKKDLWTWTHIVDTPTSSCRSSYWAASTS